MFQMKALPSIPSGGVKSFGILGPKYKVGQLLRPLHDGDWLVEVSLLETGETIEYRLSRLINDPKAY